MIRRYETILLFEIEAGEEAREAFIERSQELIKQYDGDLLTRDDWGVRKLAYEVRKKTRGFYVRLEYYARTDIVMEYERIIRLEDCVMKYITVVLDMNFDLDQYSSSQIESDNTETSEATDVDASEQSESPSDDLDDDSETDTQTDNVSDNPDDHLESADTTDAPDDENDSEKQEKED